MATENINIIDPDSGVGTDFTSLISWEADSGVAIDITAATGTDEIQVAECRATSGTPETGASYLYLSGGSWKTSPTNWVEIRRHADELSTNRYKFDSSNYYFNPSPSSTGTIVQDVTAVSHLKFIGIQLGNGTSARGMHNIEHTSTDPDGWSVYDGCIFRFGDTTDSFGYALYGYGYTDTSATPFDTFFINNLILSDYDNDNLLKWGITYQAISAGNAYDTIFYNNTAISCNNGYLADSTGVNNLLWNNIFYLGNVAADLDWTDFDYNHWSTTNSDSIGTNGTSSASFTFENVTTADYRDGDYRITSGDSGAKGKADELDSDAYYPFDWDIAGGNRGTTDWDAGMYQVTPTATLEQEGFRWRNDDNNEVSATWRQTQDINDTVEKDTNIRLRMLVNATGDPATKQYQLEYKRTSEGDNEYRKVPE